MTDRQVDASAAAAEAVALMDIADDNHNHNSSNKDGDDKRRMEEDEADHIVNPAVATDPAAAAAATRNAGSDTATRKKDSDNKEDKGGEKDGDDGDDDDDNEDDTSTTDSGLEGGDDDDVAVASTATADEILIQATQLKEEGNTHYQANELEKAARAYRRGCQLMKKLNKQNSGDAQVKGLLMALRTNLSMVLFKQHKYKHSVQFATQALAIDPANVKALYRRAVANRQMGDLDEARDDLRQALQMEPNNTACKKELAAVKKELEQTKENNKKAFAKAFDSKKRSSFLYSDKENEERIKQEQELAKKKEAQELHKKRKAEWEDECVKRMANNEPAVSFEDWEKEQKANEERERKAEEKRRKEERKQRREMEKQQRQQQQQSSERDDEDDDELTPEELAKMRGYKKTADGRTTSYFTRELSQDEKKLIGDFAPKRLGEVASGAPLLTQPTPPGLNSGGSSTEGAGASVWNRAGTWEEKNTTSWCSDALRKKLEATSVSHSTVDIDIVEVEDLTGEASVAFTGGKKRYIFDFHARLKYEIKNQETDDVVAQGTVRLPDICSTHHDEIEVSFDDWSKSPPTSLELECNTIRNDLTSELRATIQRWVQDFNKQY